MMVCLIKKTFIDYQTNLQNKLAADGGSYILLLCPIVLKVLYVISSQQTEVPTFCSKEEVCDGRLNLAAVVP